MTEMAQTKYGIDFSEIAPQIVRDRPLSDYAPKRTRQDRPASEITPAAPPSITQGLVSTDRILPMSDDIAHEAGRMTTLFQNTIKERNDFAVELNKARAQIDEMQGTQADLRSQLESARLEVADANRRTGDERAKFVRLQAILENIGGLVADGVQS